MRLLTASETEEWCRTQGVELDDRGLLSHPREGLELFGSDSDRAQSTFAQMLAQEGSQHLSVLSISPTYGFTLVAVFREMEVLMTPAPASP